MDMNSIDDTIIQPSLFYNNEKDKTKLNWFCYEIALHFESFLNDKLSKKLKKNNITKQKRAEFSIYLSKKMKSIVLEKLSGKVETIYFNYKMVEEYFPKLNDKMVDDILTVVTQAWDDMLAGCEVCPVRCVSEKDNYCDMFDHGPY